MMFITDPEDVSAESRLNSVAESDEVEACLLLECTTAGVLEAIMAPALGLNFVGLDVAFLLLDLLARTDVPGFSGGTDPR